MGTRWLWVVEGACEVRICTRGENVYARWECVRKVTLNGGGGHMRWEYVHEVRMCMQGENMHMRWLWGVEGTTLQRPLKSPRVDTRWLFCTVQMLLQWWPSCEWWKIPRVWLYIMQSHLMYLVYVREVTLRGGGEHARWELPCEVGMVMRGENCHTRWEWSHKVRIAMQGGNGHVRWELPCEVGMVTRGENCHARWNDHARYEPPSEILHSLIFLLLCYSLRSTEKFIRSRKCVCLLLVAVLVAMIVFILLVTNVIPMRRADICEVRFLIKFNILISTCYFALRWKYIHTFTWQVTEKKIIKFFSTKAFPMFS